MIPGSTTQAIFRTAAQLQPEKCLTHTKTHQSWLLWRYSQKRLTVAKVTLTHEVRIHNHPLTTSIKLSLLTAEHVLMLRRDAT